ncbi:MAG: hypothetical protein ACTFAL_04180 [Candidatus Electronema sp. V4]|uniref:hypothetical protein n=1 Tax=Candidatus Electronema sp. V4 TaxID=3454756 RepID=UPI004055854C
MTAVLLDDSIGGFHEVKLLMDESAQAVADFLAEKKRDDLALFLYQLTLFDIINNFLLLFTYKNNTAAIRKIADRVQCQRGNATMLN